MSEPLKCHICGHEHGDEYEVSPCPKCGKPTCEEHTEVDMNPSGTQGTRCRTCYDKEDE